METQKHDQRSTDIFKLLLTLPVLNWKASDRVIFPLQFHYWKPLPTAHKFPTTLRTDIVTLANDQHDAQIFNTFIAVLYMYMFQAISCSSSGGQIVLTLR